MLREIGYLSIVLICFNSLTKAQNAAMMPQIVNIEAQCQLSGMTVTIDFDRPYDGIIYSKGAFYTPGCVYVQSSSNRQRYIFDVPMNACGTVADTENPAGQSPIKYFENTLVFQNDPLFQEIWDVARKVRCIWNTRFEESIVFTPYQVDMLNSQLVSFSGDDVKTAMAVQTGRGPFAPILQEGLVQIGDTLTLVIFLQTEDSSFDVGVRDCYATDSLGRNNLQLTDENGCIIKDKLISPWQETRDTGNTGAALISYAYLNAFKFPDDMEVNIRCNIAICKGGCRKCGQIIEIIEEIVTEPIAIIRTTTTTTTPRPTTTTRRPTTQRPIRTTERRTTTTRTTPRPIRPVTVPTTRRTFRPFRPVSFVTNVPRPTTRSPTPIAQRQSSSTRKKLGFHRRRRDINAQEEYSLDFKNLGLSSKIMVVTPDELNKSSSSRLSALNDNNHLCINTMLFAAGSMITFLLLLASTMITTIFYLRQRQTKKQHHMAGFFSGRN